MTALAESGARVVSADLAHDVGEDPERVHCDVADPEALRERYPRLVTCDISGYGEEGVYADMKAYDMLVQAESGLCSVTGSPQEDGRIGVSACDIGTGLYAHAAILEALSGDLPEGTRVTIDGTRTVAIDHDVLEVLRDFQLRAEVEGIHLEVRDVAGLEAAGASAERAGPG